MKNRAAGTPAEAVAPIGVKGAGRGLRLRRGSPARWMNRAGGGAEADAESAGDDLGEGGFAGSPLVRPRGCGHGRTRFPWATSVKVETLGLRAESGVL